MNKVYIISGLLSFLSFPLIAQNSDYQAQYREKVLEYNQDLKAAGYNEAMKQEMIKSARADFKPKLSAGGNFNYTGNPLELSIDLPAMNSPLYFQGKDLKYGATLSLSQPIYTGGGLRANYQKARQEKELASNESDRIKSNTLHDADIYYWNAVAQHELVFVAQAFRTSIQQLVEVVRHRVEVEYIDRNDLLMAEVKLNDADIQLLQTRDNAEIARLALNSFAGVNPGDTLPIDHSVIALKQFIPLSDEIDNAITSRPEYRIAQNKIELQESSRKIADARFLPQFHIGVDGSYSSPGYNFKSDLDPNYAIYAKLSIPLFEWGKRKSTRNASSYAINMAQQNLSKTQDKIRLEIQTAHYNYKQAIDKVELTESSLSKASESEQMAMERYKEKQRLEAESIQAKYTALQSQLNPHFLFNSLNTLIAEIEYDPSTAVKFTQHLSEVYRYVLRQQQCQIVSLKEELDFLDSYIFLHQVRLGDCLSLERDLPDNVIDHQLPPLTLQLLAENVVKHNYIDDFNPMTIRLYTEKNGRYLCVSNTLRPKKVSNASGKGLKNLSERYQLLCKQDIQIRKNDHQFTVSIPLIYD
ncbi:TolC family protein [Parabacteroides distasonis]|uniref:TolC family protein n=1 Tax=Parabacteroides distasonis TaxID=823 RepID=UPI0039B55AB1